MNIQDFKKFFDSCEMDGDKIVISSNFKEALKWVFDNYTYKMLKDITAVDKGNGEYELIYNLYSVDDEESVYLSTYVKDEADSVTDLFKSAEADECEIYDMFGIKFIGNESLKRLYMPESWEGHPLRKDYVQADERLAWNDESET